MYSSMNIKTGIDSRNDQHNQNKEQFHCSKRLPCEKCSALLITGESKSKPQRNTTLKQSEWLVMKKE